MNLKNILLGCTLAFMTYTAQAQTQIIAHRGYWKTENNYRTEESCRSQSLRLGI